MKRSLPNPPWYALVFRRPTCDCRFCDIRYRHVQRCLTGVLLIVWGLSVWLLVWEMGQ